MKLNIFYKEEDSYNRYYFKYKIVNEEQLLTINYVDKTVHDCSSSLDVFADIELNNNYELISELEDLVYKYFNSKYKYYQTLANRYNNLSKDIYYV